MRFITMMNLILACGASAGVAAGQAPESELVAVEGVLIVGEFLGPPNYGENPSTDMIERSYVLQLPAPLATQQPSWSHGAESRHHDLGSYFVQLVVFDGLQDSATKLRGKKVKVVGSPFEAQTGHHRTPIVIDVQSIEEVSKWEW